MFNTSEEIIADIKAGKIIVLVDDEDRENEGDLICAAEFATPENINFMAIYAKGLICMPMDRTLTEKLVLTPMVDRNTDNHGTAFTVAIDHVETTTGISAFERSLTVLKAVEDDAQPEDFRRPGHIFPLKAVDNGVLARNGHTEATVDLARLAGLKPAGLCCEIMADDGTMMRTDELITFAKEHDLKIGTIADLIHYRREHESLVERVGERRLHTPWGRFRAIEYRDTVHGAPHLALVRGEPDPSTPVLTRVHECHSLLDLLDAEPSAHSWPLHAALQRIDATGCGVAVLLDCDMRGDATRVPTGHARRDGRVTGIGSQILRELGVRRLNVLSSPFRLPALSGHDLEIMAFIPLGDDDPESARSVQANPLRAA